MNLSDRRPFCGMVESHIGISKEDLLEIKDVEEAHAGKDAEGTKNIGGANTPVVTWDHLVFYVSAFSISNPALLVAILTTKRQPKFTIWVAF